MTQEDKKLLIQDLCMRFPYKVKITSPWLINVPHILCCIEPDYPKGTLDDPTINGRFKVEEIRPYLRPMSSMTDKEVDELYSIPEIRYENHTEMGSVANYQQIDWLLAHHFDFRRLIVKGLALPAPEGMYKF